MSIVYKSRGVGDSDLSVDSFIPLSPLKLDTASSPVHLLISMMISMKVLVVLFLSRAAIVMALDPASYLQVTLLL